MKRFHPICILIFLTLLFVFMAAPVSAISVSADLSQCEDPVCEWRFGDGNSTTGCGARVYSYSDPGTYNATFSVDCGAFSQEVTRQVNVSGANVRASCQAHLEAGHTKSGTYKIDPDGPGGQNPFEAYCDMEQDGGGWTLVAVGESKNTAQLSPGNHKVGEVNSPDQASHGRLAFSTWNEIGDVVRWQHPNGETVYFSRHRDKAITMNGWIEEYNAEPTPECSTDLENWESGRGFHIADCHGVNKSFGGHISTGMGWNGCYAGVGCGRKWHILNMDGGTAWVR